MNCIIILRQHSQFCQNGPDSKRPISNRTTAHKSKGELIFLQRWNYNYCYEKSSISDLFRRLAGGAGPLLVHNVKEPFDSLWWISSAEQKFFLSCSVTLKKSLLNEINWLVIDRVQAGFFFSSTYVALEMVWLVDIPHVNSKKISFYSVLFVKPVKQKCPC